MSDAAGDLPLHLLRTFDAAAQAPSFSVAATRLGITQPAVSQQMRQLESMLGQPLFARLGRGVELTEAGQQLAADVGPAMAQLVRGWGRFHDGADDHRVAIRGNNTVLVRWLVPRLGTFLELHPEVEIDLDATFWPGDTSDVGAVVMEAGPMPSGAVAIPGDQRQVAVAAPSVARRVRWPDLRGETLLDVRGGPGWAAFVDESGADAPQVGEGRRITSITHLNTIELAVHGTGVALAHRLVVDDLVTSGALEVLATAAAPSVEPFYAVFPRRDRLTGATDEFRRWLLSQ